MSARGFPLSWQPSAGTPSQRHQFHLCHFIHVLNLNQLPIYTLTSAFHAGGRIKPVNLNINPKSDNCLSETRPQTRNMWRWQMGAGSKVTTRGFEGKWDEEDVGRMREKSRLCGKMEQDWRCGCGWGSSAPQLLREALTMRRSWHDVDNRLPSAAAAPAASLHSTYEADLRNPDVDQPLHSLLMQSDCSEGLDGILNCVGFWACS